MKKQIYLVTLIIIILSFHYQLLAQQQGSSGYKTVIKNEKVLVDLHAVPYICDFEAIQNENFVFISAEYNTEIKQETNAAKPDYLIKKYVDLATSEIRQIYGADAILSLKSEVRTNENGEMIIFLTGVPVKWTNFRSVADFNREKGSSKTKTGTQKKDALGVDFGIGSLMYKEKFFYGNAVIPLKFSAPVFAVGIRYMHHYNPYIGVDVLKFNFICPFRVERERGLMNFQFMTGIRGNTPSFFKTMSGYGVARMGYGLHFIEQEFLHGIAFETEVGLNLSSIFFIAFSYNLMSFFVDGAFSFIDPYYGTQYFKYSATANISTYAFRFGINF